MLRIIEISIKIIEKIFSKSYGSELEQYIISRDPKNTGDVERYTIEYNSKVSKSVPYL